MPPMLRNNMLRTKINSNDLKHKVNLTMVQAITKSHPQPQGPLQGFKTGGFQGGRFSSGGRPQIGRFQPNDGCCFLCGDPDHWAKDCSYNCEPYTNHGPGQEGGGRPTQSY